MGDGAAAPFTRRFDDLVAVAAGLVVLVVCGLIVRNGTVGAAELRVFRAINGLPNALFAEMNAFQLGGVFAVGPLVAVVACVLRKWRLAVAALLASAGKLLAERAVWHFVQRSRPGTTIHTAIIRGNTPVHGPSFVSGHMVLASALAWVVTPYLRGWWRAIPWVVVGLVGTARMYLGAHAPSTWWAAWPWASSSAVWRTSWWACRPAESFETQDV